MKIAMLVMLALSLSACASNESRLADFFDRLEFKEGQTGCIRATGQISLSGNPFVSSGVNVSLVKKQGDDAQDC